ncbi:universal stress protein [Jeotgalibacillus sp. S-D1]|uniref:universal stress protein n=1 Tax=Jeotgalibacillus sp. S-D1 TaxID=2552189 RepID=UPI00105A2768|nr:universal stress protein [Jeotgalibacillus sp. S-D1]TDL31048.1 universal stress protein [Jeotgalibacillus sp. S-D1]
MKKIMVASDGSDHSTRALKKAIQIGSSQESVTIDLVYVVDGDTSKADVLHYGDSDTASFKRQKMMEQQAEIAREAGLQTDIKILHGSASETLIDYANNGSYDLVLVGSRGRNKLQTMLLGSVSHKLIKHIDAPVMVVK